MSKRNVLLILREISSFFKALYFHQIALLYDPDSGLKCVFARDTCFVNWVNWGHGYSTTYFLLRDPVEKDGDLKVSGVNPLLQWSRTATGVALLYAY